MKEEWRKIDGYLDRYEVSNIGRVRSLDGVIKYSNGRESFRKGVVLNPTQDKRGYQRVCIRTDKNEKAKKLVHQLVAIAFLGHTPNGWSVVVDHVDEDKSNNNLSNLQLLTNRANISKSKIGGTSKYVGVSWKKSDKKWRSSIRINGKNIHLGNFDCEYSAHLAYQDKLRSIEHENCQHIKKIGESCMLNNNCRYPNCN